jgi:chemotaxis protein CheD
MTLPRLATDKRIGPARRRIHLIQGESYATGNADIIMTTTLGSCVATCMCDPVAKLGGMNHFLLPYGGDREGPEAERYGAYAMEMLINGLMRLGARRDRLEAKLFGGGRLDPGLPDIGSQNVEFAEHFLKHEDIKVKQGSVRGKQARCLQFWPASGRVRQLFLGETDETIFQSESRTPPASGFGSVELFGS